MSRELLQDWLVFAYDRLEAMCGDRTIATFVEGVGSANGTGDPQTIRYSLALGDTIRDFESTITPCDQHLLAMVWEVRGQTRLRPDPSILFLLATDGTFLDFATTDSSMLALHPSQFMGRNIRDLCITGAVDHLIDRTQAMIDAPSPAPSLQDFLHQQPSRARRLLPTLAPGIERPAIYAEGISECLN